VSDGIAGLGGDFGSVAGNIIDTLVNAGSLQDAMISGAFGGINSMQTPNHPVPF